MLNHTKSPFDYDFIIAPNKVHRELLRAKKHFPYSHTKLITRDDLFSSLFYTIDEKAFLSILSHFPFSYQAAKNYFQNLRFFNKDCSTDKLKTLFAVFEYVKITKHFEKGLGNAFFKGKTALVMNYAFKDSELKTLLNLAGLTYDFYQNEESVLSAPLYVFNTVSDEVSYQLNVIARLIASGVDTNDIVILTPGNDYYLDLKLWAKTYGLLLNLGDRQNLLTYPRVLMRLKSLETALDIDAFVKSLKEETLSEEEVQFLNTLIKYPFFGIKKEDYLLLIKDKLANIKLKHETYKPHLEVVDELPHNITNKHVFILGFTKGTYPKVKLDNEFVFDFEKEKLGLNTSKIENEISHDLLLNFLKSDHHFYFSYAKEVKGVKQMVSDLATVFALKEESAPLTDNYYSRTLLTHYYGDLMDKNVKFNLLDANIGSLKPLVGQSYRSYNNSFTGITHYTEDSFLSLSFTQVDAYYACPYRYYLDRVLKIRDFESTLPMLIGTLFHKMLELSDQQEIDIAAFIHNYLKERNIAKRDYLIILGMKDIFSSALTLKQELEAQMQAHKTLGETNLVYKIDKNTQISGQIDRIYEFKDGGLVLIDYKTGVKKFEPTQVKHGKSLQLPIYTLLMKNESRYKDAYIIGLFLQSLKQEGILITDDEDERYLFYKESFKFSGILLDDVDKLLQFDSTFVGTYSHYIRGTVYYEKAAKWGQHTPNYKEEEMLALADIAKEKIIEAAKAIRRNEFPIRPLLIDGEDSCAYCPFAHVCYKTNKDYLEITSKEKKKKEDSSDEI